MDRGARSALLQLPAIPQWQEDSRHLAETSARAAPQQLALRRAYVPPHAGPVPLGCVAWVRAARRTPLRTCDRPAHTSHHAALVIPAMRDFARIIQPSPAIETSVSEGKRLVSPNE